MRGTNIKDGHGIIEVKKVGDATEFGKVAEKASEMTGEVTPLNKQLDKLAKFIGVLGFSLAIFTFFSLFIKDLFFSDIQYEFKQLGSIAIVILSVIVALTKVWFPIMYDAFELLGKEKKLPKIVDEGSWFKWTFFGAATFLVLFGISYLIGINPLDSSSYC